MKRLRILVLAVAMFALAAFPGTAFAESLSGGNGWSVTYTAGGTMEDTFSSTEYADVVSKLQPGDDITLTVTLNQQNATASDWYMANEVLKSLEEGAAKDSAYGYVLTYIGPNGNSTTLYDSSKVGGDSTGGLTEATSGLEDFFYLDNLQQGQTATVKLVVTLDGETEGNAYFNTLARLKMKFAVDPTGTRGTTTNTNTNKNTTRNVVKTGDDTDLFPFYVTMVVSGALLVALGAVTVRQRKKAREEGSR